MKTDSIFHLNSLKKKSGFTIIEAITALVILCISAIAIFSSLHAGFSLINDIRENIIVSSCIQEELEELRKTIFVSLPSVGTTTFYNNSLSTLRNPSGTVTVDEYSGSNILRVTIAVTWQSPLKQNRYHTKRVVTLIARNGINSI